MNLCAHVVRQYLMGPRLQCLADPSESSAVLSLNSQSLTCKTPAIFSSLFFSGWVIFCFFLVLNLTTPYEYDISLIAQSKIPLKFPLRYIPCPMVHWQEGQCLTWSSVVFQVNVRIPCHPPAHTHTPASMPSANPPRKDNVHCTKDGHFCVVESGLIDIFF